MNFPDVSGRRLIAILTAATLLGLIIISQTIPMLLQVGYGVPSPNGNQVEFTDTVTDSTVTTTVSGQFFAWSFAKTSYTETYRREVLGTYQQIVLQMDVNLIVKVEVTAPASPTEITEQVVIFKIAEDPTRNVTIFQKTTYHVFSYSFKVNTALTGTVNILEVSYTSTCPFNCVSREDMAEFAAKALISQFNANAYEIMSKILWDMNAPTLAAVAVPSPGYAGIMGLFLQDYILGGYTTGTAADIQPQGIGTVVALCLDKTLNCPSNRLAWHLDSPTPTNWIAPDDFVYYPDHFATPYAYWHTDILSLGSTISFTRAKDYPNYWTWAYQVSGITPSKESCLLPCVAQWFRVDILELTSEPLEVPNYQVTQNQQLNQAILVPDEPFNLGTSSAPEVPWEERIRLFLLGLWNTAKWIVIGLFVIFALVLAFTILRKIP